MAFNIFKAFGGGYNQITNLGSTIVLNNQSGDAVYASASGNSAVIKLPSLSGASGVRGGDQFFLQNIGVNNSISIQNEFGVEQVKLNPGWYTMAVAKTTSYEFQTCAPNQPFTLSLYGVDTRVTGNYNIFFVPTGVDCFVTSAIMEVDYSTGCNTGFYFNINVSGNSKVIAGPIQGQVFTSTLFSGKYCIIAPNINADTLNGDWITFNIPTGSTGVAGIRHDINLHLTCVFA